MSKGVYALFLKVNRNIKINVGSLGTVHFRKGYYVYVGSAQNNLEKRVIRHCKKAKRIFWHADYLLSNKFANVAEVFFKSGPKAEECMIAERVQSIGVPVVGFGSSDCRCTSHLCKMRIECPREDC